METADCRSVECRCRCTKCRENEHHGNGRVHALLARLAKIVPAGVLEGASGAIVHQFRHLLSPAELRELEETIGISLSLHLSRYESQLAKAEAQVTIARSRWKDFAQNTTSEQMLEQIAHKWWMPLNELQRIDLWMNGVPYSVRIPSGHGAWALQEVLFANSYNHKLPKVDAIYDLGAFIGVTSLLLRSIYPEAHLTCVEPSPHNLTFLTDNLESNLTNFRIVPAAVFDGRAEIVMAMDTSPSMLNSVRWSKSGDGRAAIPTVKLRELVAANSYGIKIDIEGAEFSLQSSAETLRSAQWIMGELHFDESIAVEDMWFLDLLQEQFVLELSVPRFADVGGQYIIAQEFWAYNRRNS